MLKSRGLFVVGQPYVWLTTKRFFSAGVQLCEVSLPTNSSTPVTEPAVTKIKTKVTSGCVLWSELKTWRISFQYYMCKFPAQTYNMGDAFSSVPRGGRGGRLAHAENIFGDILEVKGKNKGRRKGKGKGKERREKEGKGKRKEGRGKGREREGKEKGKGRERGKGNR